MLSWESLLYICSVVNEEHVKSSSKNESSNGLTESLNVEREKLVILDEVVDLETVGSTAGGTCNDKLRHGNDDGMGCGLSRIASQGEAL